MATSGNRLDVYLIAVDYYSNYPEVARLYNTPSTIVISKLKSIFARHRKCETLISDNGPQYASGEFAKFANEWGFNHEPHIPSI